MIKILTTEQVRKADKATIAREPIESVDLMERAGAACAEWISQRFPQARPFVVLAGVGNNGGDALVVSRRLIEKGYHVSTFIIRYSEKFSADLQVNLDRLAKMSHEVSYILEESQFPSISGNAVIIDGLLGSGLNRATEGFVSACIKKINASKAEVISIDIPSGLFADKQTPKGSAIVRAAYTLTFEVPKLSFLLPGADWWTGSWTIIPIGLDQQFISKAKSDHYLVDGIAEFRSRFLRHKFDHKGKFGHTLMVCGGHGKMGAAVLSSRAAMRSGSGLVTAHIPRSGYTIMQTALPEAMCVMDEHTDFITAVPGLDGYDSLGVGPGIGTHKKTRKMLQSLLRSFKNPAVIDADAINLLASIDSPREWIFPNSILTPHIREFERLFGPSKNEFERLVKLQESAHKWGVFILLKGAYSILATPDEKLYFNNTGNPGMAKGGSGDVLTGMIAAFLAQTNDPFVSALCAMYIHGYAGDLAAKRVGQHAMMASDITEEIGVAMRFCFSFGV